MSRSTGNAITEYGFVAAILLITGIAALMALGSGFQGVLAALKGDMGKNTAAAVAQKQKMEQQKLLAQAKENGGPGGKPAKGISDIVKGYEPVCFSGGCVNIPVISKETVKTAGGNGGQLTKEFASVLSQLADALAKDPDADPTLAEMVRKLANQGHEMGDFQKSMLKSSVSTQQAPTTWQCSGGGDNQTCTQVSTDGKWQIGVTTRGSGDNSTDELVAMQSGSRNNYWNPAPTTPPRRTATWPSCRAPC